jgi:hypothetical protein
MFDLLKDILYLLGVIFITLQINSLIINSTFIFDYKKLIKSIFLKDCFRINYYANVRDKIFKRFY